MDYKTYLAVSENGGYSLMHRGNPLTRDGQTIQECQAQARHYGLKIEAIWNGFKGQFEVYAMRSPREGE